MSLFRVAVGQCISVLRYSIVILTLPSHLRLMYLLQTISHKMTPSNRVCGFQTLDAVFPIDLFSDYLEITTADVVSCGGSKTSPRTSI